MYEKFLIQPIYQNDQISEFGERDPFQVWQDLFSTASHHMRERERDEDDKSCSKKTVYDAIEYYKTERGITFITKLDPKGKQLIKFNISYLYCIFLVKCVINNEKVTINHSSKSIHEVVLYVH